MQGYSGVIMSKLVCNDLYKHYGTTTAADHLSFTLEEGIYGLLGPNGAGKTTLINMLASIERPDSGEIFWNGKNTADLSGSYRKHLGYMPQQQSLNEDFTVLGFMHYMAALKKIQKPESEIGQLLKKVNLNSYRKYRLNQLSGGMKQRLLFAQALLNNPDILILDEPTVGLDPLERSNIRQLITDCSAGKIIILATHITADVEFIADRIILMKAGRILAIQEQEQLLAETKVFESEKSITELLKSDANIKIVNQKRNSSGITTRYISEKSIGRRSESTLDDVYIDRLG